MQLKILNEKEIQERLYGQHRAGARSEPAQMKKRTPLTAPISTSTQVKTKTRPKPNFSAAVSGGAEKIGSILPSWQAVGQLFTWFSWKVVGIVAAAVILSFLGVKVVSFMYEAQPNEPKQTQLESTKPLRTLTVSTPVEQPIQREPQVRIPIQKAQAESPQKPVVVSGVGAGLTPAVATEKKTRSYGVQIITYQRERDAQKLTSELKSLDFDAFYKSSRSRQRGISYYVVYLGKKDSFAGAQKLLQQFKASQLFSKFSDSFIRSL